MARINLEILTICLLWMFNPVMAQEVWRERFSIAGKGIQGSNGDTLHYDLEGVHSWTLEYMNAQLNDPGDYAKTVSTSGGRFEACDINGEIAWRSEWITIAGAEKVSVELTAAETGSGANTNTKYMKVYYRLDEGNEILFSQNGINAGNWGSVQAKQTGLKGNRLQLICYISTHYAADKVILDEVSVWLEQETLPPVKRYDVVINELMADPIPPEGLPAVEYIELYNARDVPVNIENWELCINHTGNKLSPEWVAPGEYLLLCATSSLDSLKGYGKIFNVAGFPGLLNKGAVVEIKDETGNIIDQITYSDAWYGDAEKAKGGFSLERIDPFRYCNQPENWKASNHPDGGTPGRKNAVYADNKDEQAPFVKWAVAITDTSVELLFSEPVDSLLINDPRNYTLKEFGVANRVEMISNEQVVLCFNSLLVKDKIYVLQVENIADECGNLMGREEFEFQWNSVKPGDVVINELLFDPFPEGEDFVEIYNRSEKLIDLSGLSLANRNKDKVLNQVYPLTEIKRILYPDEYLVLTRDSNSVFPWYSIFCRACFLQMERIPSFPNAGGCVVLLNEQMEVIDEFFYNEKMHSPFLADAEGVSLERISFTEPAFTPDNWYSASGDAGYATPGYRNSQAGKSLHAKPFVTFEPEAFSPNQDGFNDVYIIHYQLNHPGYMATISIFDAAGHYVRHLAKNELLGTSGEFFWNGKDEAANRLPLGVYVVMVELFNDEGEVYHFKDGVVLTDVLE